jgi:hypothetical protein
VIGLSAVIDAVNPFESVRQSYSFGECLALDAVDPVATNVAAAVAYVGRSDRTKTT